MRYVLVMDIGVELRLARRRAGLTQRALAAHAGTSQETLSAYESGRRQPTIETLTRLLAGTDSRLAIERGRPAVVPPSASQAAEAARTLSDVLALAEALPTRHDPVLRYPRLRSRPTAEA